MARYDSTFFSYTQRHARDSARVLLEVLTSQLAVGSVLDVGCGQGAWLEVWRSLGIETLFGLDGDYVDRSALQIAPSEFLAHDLTEPIQLGRSFDLVQCLEVAEHLPPSAATTLLETLVGHGDVILFSAATPGQGGVGHVNERPLEYWRRLFASHGYQPYDAIRPRLVGDDRVSPWYRFNTLLYARPGTQVQSRLRSSEIADGRAIGNLAPISYRLRCQLLRWLPPVMVTWLAARWNAAIAKRSGSTEGERSTDEGPASPG